VLDERERVRRALEELGIVTTVHPLPIHLQPAFACFTGADSCPIATEMAAMVMNLPMSSALDPTSAQRVAEAVLRAAGVAVPQPALPEATT
jgi:UDP-2-acetamido-2-deoxy-ribo-hexuluronate aminotransferase